MKNLFVKLVSIALIGIGLYSSLNTIFVREDPDGAGFNDNVPRVTYYA